MNRTINNHYPFPVSFFARRDRSPSAVPRFVGNCLLEEEARYIESGMTRTQARRRIQWSAWYEAPLLLHLFVIAKAVAMNARAWAVWDAARETERQAQAAINMRVMGFGDRIDRARTDAEREREMVSAVATRIGVKF